MRHPASAPVVGALLALAAICLGAAAPAAACGPESACTVGERGYRIVMPPGHDGATPVGAIVFIHGYKGSAAGAMANDDLRETAAELGLALIAADSVGDDWALPGAPGQTGQGASPDGSAEITYFEAVVADAAARFAIDTDRLMAAGFSSGAMMTWTLACRRARLFAGFAPISGTFWRPIPESCPSPPAHVLHLHGEADEVVPISGRRIEDAHQGDVREVLAMYRAQGGYGEAARYEDGALSCRRWTNPDDKALEFCRHEGGHRIRGAYIARAWRRLARLGAFAD